MITLTEFMGGGHSAILTTNQTLKLGRGRCRNYRPNSGTIDLSLQDPSRAEYRPGANIFIVVNTTASPGDFLYIKDHNATTIGTIDQREIGFISMYEEADGTRQWACGVYERIIV